MKRRYLLRALKFLVKVMPISFWLVLLFAFDKPYIAVLTLISAAIHELGHVLALKRCKRRYSFFGVGSGFRIRADSTISYGEELFTALAGPLANVAVLLVLLPFILLGTYPYASVFAAVNLFTALSNLIPIEGYDGYRVISCIINRRTENKIHSEILRATSFLLTAVIALISLYIIRSFDGGYWIFFIFLTSLIRAICKSSTLLGEKRA